jgi:SAM-dependent methyltransferase
LSVVSEVANSRIEEIVQALGPTAILDVGCGCGGHLTSALARHCARVVAVDVSAHMSRWQEIARSSGVSFCCMDARALGFASDSIPLVLERASLHHVARWSEALAEMIRVSSGRILLQEPVDDQRSAAKRRTYEAQDLFLELQAEVGYSHHRHLSPEAMISAIKGRAVLIETRMERSDTPVAFDEFFESFHSFAARSEREGYWIEQLQELRYRLGGASLCEDDTLTILAAKDGNRSSP